MVNLTSDLGYGNGHDINGLFSHQGRVPPFLVPKAHVADVTKSAVMTAIAARIVLFPQA